MATNSMVAWDFFDDVMLSASGPGDVPDADWDEYVDAVDTYLTRRPDARGIVVNDETKLTPRQRQRLNDTIARRSPNPGPTVLITESVLARGMITAMNWVLKREVKSFSPAQLDAALTEVGIPPQGRALIATKLRAAAAKAGARCLERVGRERTGA